MELSPAIGERVVTDQLRQLLVDRDTAASMGQQRTGDAAGGPAPYFVNATFDFTFAGGLSIATFVVLWSFGSPQQTVLAREILLTLVWFINYPHFSATLQRLFRRRENAAQYPLTAYLLPLVVLGGIVASFASPHTFAPYFVKLMLMWSSYHFSGQTLGVTLIYARRQGVRLDRRERRALSTFIYSTYLGYMLTAGIVAGSYYGVDYPGFAVPSWIAALPRWTTWCSGGFLIAFALSWSLEHRRLFPVIVLLPAVTQYLWFLPGFTATDFFIFVPLFHSLQYLP
ncbi:MAG TPA: hypothetical protein VMT89_01330, partial [Candidatus Acidoferrales bacterium]|nr:hypothetical protein [Candidatus Acidoferrales bacterium]